MIKPWKMSLIVLMLLLVLSAPFTSMAGSLEDIYNEVAQRYPGDIQTLNNYGASEGDIRAFIAGLEGELSGKGELTEENFDSEMADALISLYLRGQYMNVFDAVFNGWNLEPRTLLEALAEGGTGRVMSLLPASLKEIGLLVKERLLAQSGSGPGPAPAPGGPAGQVPPTSPPTGKVGKDLVEKQLQEGKPEVTFTAPTGSKEVEITGEALARLVVAGKDLVLKVSGVTFRVPAEAFKVTEPKASLVIKAETLPQATAQNLKEGLPPEYKGEGKVYEFTATSGQKVTEPGKEITVTLSYEGMGISPEAEEKLGAYFYNETAKEWEYLGGKVDREKKTVAFKASHFSKYTLMAYDKTFTDIATHWAEKDIEYMASRHVARGVSATEFQPESLVTRAQFAALLVRTLGLKADQDYQLAFSDVAKSSWYYDEVAAAFRAGIVKGVSVTEFAPQDNITREQVAAMVVRAMAYAGKKLELSEAQIQQTLSRFNDAGGIAAWAQAEVAAAVELGIVKGRTENTFVAKANATRAEGTVMIKRMYAQLP